MPSNLQLDSKVNHNSHPIDLNRYSSSPLKRPMWYQIKLSIFGKKDVWCISTVSFIMVLNSSVDEIDVYNLVRIRSKYIEKTPNCCKKYFLSNQLHLTKFVCYMFYIFPGQNVLSSSCCCWRVYITKDMSNRDETNIIIIRP